MLLLQLIDDGLDLRPGVNVSAMCQKIVGPKQEERFSVLPDEALRDLLVEHLRPDMKSLLSLKLGQVTRVLPAKPPIDCGNEAVDLKEQNQLATTETAMEDNDTPSSIDSHDVVAFVMDTLQASDVGDGTESDQLPCSVHGELE